MRRVEDAVFRRRLLVLENCMRLPFRLSHGSDLPFGAKPSWRIVLVDRAVTNRRRLQLATCLFLGDDCHRAGFGVSWLRIYRQTPRTSVLAGAAGKMSTVAKSVLGNPSRIQKGGIHTRCIGQNWGGFCTMCGQ